MKTIVFVIMMSGNTLDDQMECGQHILLISESVPHADVHCLYPSYAMRPVARPTEFVIE